MWAAISFVTGGLGLLFIAMPASLSLATDTR